MFVPAAFASLCAWRLRVAESAPSIVRLAYPSYACWLLCAESARPWPSVKLDRFVLNGLTLDEALDKGVVDFGEMTVPMRNQQKGGIVPTSCL